MKCLFVDLASHDALLACVTEEEVVASESVHARISDAELIPMTEAVLKKAGWTYEDLDHLACIIGPGGFTSLRVAVTFVNVLSDQLGIPVAGIHLSDLYMARAESDAYWLHSTKKQQLFVRGGKWSESTLIDVADMPQGDWMGELIDDHRSRIESDPINLQPVQEVLPAFLHSLNYALELLQPWYGRGW